MNLHDHFTDTLDTEPGPDLAALTRTARTRGTRLRRRRTTALVVAAGVAALGLAGGVALVQPGAGETSLVATDPGVPAPQVVRPDLAGPTAPTTGQGAVLALQWAVDQQRAGTASGLTGQLGEPSGDHYVELHWADADGLGASLVGLNVQDHGGMGTSCPVASCTDTVTPDGSRLITYEERYDKPGGTAIRRVVDLRRADGMRVVVSSTNGFEHGGGRWDLTRAQPPLSLADLETIVRQPFWGPTLPVAWIQAGAGLQGYTDLDADPGDFTSVSELPTPSGPTSSGPTSSDPTPVAPSPAGRPGRSRSAA